MEVIKSLLEQAMGSAGSINDTANRARAQVLERRNMDMRMFAWHHMLRDELDNLCGKVAALQNLRAEADAVTRDLQETRAALQQCREMSTSGDVDLAALAGQMDQLRVRLAEDAKVLNAVVDDHNTLLMEARDHEKSLHTEIQAFEARCAEGGQGALMGQFDGYVDAERPKKRKLRVQG